VAETVTHIAAVEKKIAGLKRHIKAVREDKPVPGRGRPARAEGEAPKRRGRPPKKAAAKTTAKTAKKSAAKASVSAKAPADMPADEKKQEACDLVFETYEALLQERGEEDRIWGSMIKQALKRRKPGFTESYYGFRSFGELIEEAKACGLIDFHRDEKSGGFIVTAAP